MRRSEEQRARPVMPPRVVGPLGFAVDAETGERVPDRLKADATGCKCPPEEDTARQEFKAEADTSTILQRYGAGATFPMPQSGVVDYTGEFREVADAAAAARQAFERLPIKLRRGYSSWQEFLRGVAAGEVDVPVPASEAAAGSSAGGEKAAPSESAAEGAPKGAGGGDKAS